MRKNYLTILLFVIIPIMTTKLSAQVTFFADTSWGCAPLGVQFTNTSENNFDTTGVTFRWYVENSEFFKEIQGYHLNHVFDNPGRYSIRLQADGYGESEPFEVQVNGVPSKFIISTGNSACPNENINFYISHDLDYEWIRWDFGDGSFSNWSWTNHQYNSAGDYTVSMVMQPRDCEIDTVEQIISITNSAIPPIEGIVEGETQFCPGDEVHFNLKNWDVKYDSIHWNFGDGTYSNKRNPTHTFTAGAKQIIVTGWNSCNNENSDTVVVHVKTDISVTADFNFWPSGGGSICPKNQVNFNAYNTGSYLWDFGDGTTSTMKNPPHYFPDTGTYDVNLIISNNCGYSDTSNQMVEVRYDPDNWKPDSRIAFEDMSDDITSITICTGEEVQFQNWTWSENGVNYTWNFDDGKISNEKQPSHVFNSNGVHQVSMIAMNNCQAADTAYLQVIVDPNSSPNAEIMVMQDSICIGETFYFVANEKDVEQQKYTYSIWYGDGNSSLNMKSFGDPSLPVFPYNYQAVGDYDYTFVATNKCGIGDTIEGTAYVTDQGISEPFLMVGNSTVEMTDPLINDIPDWGTRKSVNDHVVELPVNWSDWREGMEENFFLFFSYDSLYEGMIPDGMLKFKGPGEAKFYIPDEGEDSLSVVAVWFCDGIFKNYDTDAVGLLEQAIKIVPGDSTVIEFPGIVMENDRWEGKCRDRSSCPGDTVSFYALGGKSYEWHFGDGSLETANGSFVKHVYADSGLFEAFVVITDGCGQKDTIKTIVLVGNYNVPDVWIEIDNEQICLGDTLWFNRRNHDDPFEVDNNQYNWDFGDGKISNQKTPFHVYTKPGSYEIVLTATNSCGSYENERHVYVDGPSIEFFADNVVLSQKGQAAFTNKTQNAASYEWDFGNGKTSTELNPVVTYETHGMFNVSLSAITYSGCRAKLEKPNYITVLFSPIISGETLGDVSCKGLSDGFIDIMVTSGTPPYTYAWSNGKSTQDIADVPAGSYSVTITDNMMVKTVKSFTINEPGAIQATFTETGVSCFGESDGAADATISGGTSPYTYSWSNGSTSSSISGVPAGKYYLYITDKNGCNGQDSIYITSVNSQISISPTVGDASSCTHADGNISLNVSGGTAGYSYVWNPNVGTGSFVSNLNAGSYVVTVTDGAGCTASKAIAVNVQGQPAIDIQQNKSVSCAGSTDAILQVNVPGSTSDYTYAWNTNPVQTTDQAIDLGAGEYSVEVTRKSDNCKSSATFTIDDPEPLFVNMEVNDPLCPGNGDGNAKPIVTGGQSPYAFIWPLGWDQQENMSLYAGSYMVTVTDDRGCSVTKTAVLSDPPAMNLIPDVYHVSYRKYSDGAVNLSVVNGTPPFEYNWSSGQSSQDLESLLAGIYSVTVTDANSCSASLQGIEVKEPAMIDVNITANKAIPLCQGETVTLDAGENFSTYLWSTGALTRTITVDTSGQYYVLAKNDTTFGHDTIDVVVQYPYAGDEICLVTIDKNTLKNMVVYNRTANKGTEGYIVYREGQVINKYDSLTSLDFDSLGIYVDKSSVPETRRYRYKIATVDTWGNISSKSSYHWPLFLQFNMGKLTWQEYEIEGGNSINFETYIIYRGVDSTLLEPIDTLPASESVYTDNDKMAQSNIFFYRIEGLMTNECDPGTLGKKSNAGPFSRSLSNLEDNRQQVSGIKIGGEKQSLSVYPNPYKDKTSIVYQLNEISEVKVFVYNLLGTKLVEIVNEVQVPGRYEYKFSAKELGYPSGIYLLEFESNGKTSLSKLVEID